MGRKIEIAPLQQADYHDLSMMVGELLDEIMNRINARVFQRNQQETEATLRDLVAGNRYWVFVARNTSSRANIGFASVYEGRALYTQGAFGVIPELYVRPDWRCSQVGKMLLDRVCRLAREKGWRRIEVTTPPLPEFDRTLSFYCSNGFEITGGRKLKIDIEP